MQDVWTAVDGYFGDLLIARDEKLDAALAANRKAGLPAIDVSRLQGKFLELLVRISGARRILEIGSCPPSSPVASSICRSSAWR